MDLNEDESGLERFLSEDLLYDVSPLPKDDEDDNLCHLNLIPKEGSRETLHNEMQSLEESALYDDTSTNPIILTTTDSLSDDDNDDRRKKQQSSAVLAKSEPQVENNAVSRSESLYYTPDDTLEELSDLTIN